MIAKIAVTSILFVLAAATPRQSAQMPVADDLHTWHAPGSSDR